MQDNGFNICNKIVKIKASKLLCDAPAKSFVLYTKGHTGFYSYTKCTQSGIFINNRLAFPDINVDLRTDESFKNKLDDEFHKGTTLLKNINIELVSQIPLDGMHLVFLGVMKKLITFWVRGPKNIRFTDDEKKAINDQILFLKNYVPKNFGRLPRSLDDIEYFKAAELRQFLLYIGPIVLQNMRNKNMYTHFMTLSCAICILCILHYIQFIMIMLCNLFSILFKNIQFFMVLSSSIITYTASFIYLQTACCTVHLIHLVVSNMKIFCTK